MKSMNRSHHDSVIEVVQLTKRYGKLVAVDQLDLTVPAGVCFGLLGPNGAGKTTLIEIIEDIIAPTAGDVLYMGRPRAASFREQIGIMFQQTALLSFMTVYETLETFQSLYSKSHPIERLIDLCHLNDIRSQLNDKISGGQRQRLLLALALINQPNLVFLDEPSTGLDPQSRRNMWDIVDAIKAEGKSIILTTHYMEEAEQLCDLVAIMDKGKIVVQGTPVELIRRHGGGSQILLPLSCLADGDANIPLDYQVTDHHIRIGTDEINQAVGALLGAGVDLTRMAVRTPSLETVFLNLTGRRLRE
jgi:ABC-2 type transport system ATP-binding protein